MPGGQRHHRGLQSGPERTGGEQLGQPGAGPCATVPAAQLMGAMLAHDHADRRQLKDLTAAEPPARPALLIVKPPPASATRVWVVIDDLIHLVLRFEIATRTRVPGLPTRRSALALPAHQLLGLRPRLRPPLRAGPGRIRRRRLGTSARILARLLLQAPQPILVQPDTLRQPKDELHTRLATRVIDRLRLGAVHARKIRCTKQESLPQASTTERLHNLRCTAVMPDLRSFSI